MMVTLLSFVVSGFDDKVVFVKVCNATIVAQFAKAEQIVCISV